MKLSIIIPVLNEAPIIGQILSSLQPIRRRGHEVIVVDGGSDDQSLLISAPFSDKVTQSLRGRSRQMNAGADLSTGEILLFLHADTSLPNDADRLIIEGMNDRHRLWGRFDVKFSGRHPLLRVIEFLMNWRSRLSGIATGDQGIFVERDFFEKIGGGDISSQAIVSKVIEADRKANPPPEEPVPMVPVSKPEVAGLVVRGTGGMLTQLAKCCKPVPGDPIVGFVTRGRGVTVHHRNCVNIVHSNEAERLIEVSWGTSQRTYPVTIKISAYDRDGLLRDVATVVAGEGVSMSSVQLEKPVLHYPASHGCAEGEGWSPSITDHRRQRF